MKLKKEKKMAEFTFEIEEHLLTLSENEKVGPRKLTV